MTYDEVKNDYIYLYNKIGNAGQTIERLDNNLTLQKEISIDLKQTIKELEFQNKGFKEQYNKDDELVNNLRKQVKELESDNKNMQIAVEGLIDQATKDLKQVESLKKKLLDSQGLIKICSGAGECDYDGSTCNEKDNCGEYTPVIKKVGE